MYRAVLPFLLCCLLACKSSAPPPPPPVDTDAELKAMRAGCAQAVREPNEARYAEIVVKQGVDPELAKAEATFALAKAQKAIENVCECMFEWLGSKEVLLDRIKNEEHFQQNVQAEIAALPKDKMEQCVDGMAEELKSLKPSQEEVDAFRKDYEAKHPK